MKKLENKDYYFVVFNSFDNGIVAAITPKAFFDRNGSLDDSSHTVENLKGWSRIMESTYEYFLTFPMEKLHNMLARKGFVFSEEMALFLYKLGNGVFIKK